MAVGKGSMARASRAAGKKKSEAKGTDTIPAEVIETGTADPDTEKALKIKTAPEKEETAPAKEVAAPVKKAAPAKVKTKQTSSRKPRVKKDTPKKAEKTAVPGIITIGEEMPVYYY